MRVRLSWIFSSLVLLAVAAVAARAQDPTTPAPLPHVSLHPDAAPAAQQQTAPPPAGTPEQAAPAPQTPAADAATPAASAAPEGQPAAAAEAQPAQADAPASADTPATETAATPAAAPKPDLTDKKGKKEKDVYTGPTEIVTLPPTPMLDEEGKQMLDPDGKPMFNAPVKQQRDKKGHPLFDAKNKPVFQTATELGYDEHGKKLHVEKEKPPKLTPVNVSRGTFTVDGVIGKAELNYDIKDLKYIYLYVPGMGVTVISNVAFPGAKEQPNAFDGNTLRVKVNDHTLELASDKQLLDKKPVSAFILVNRDFVLPTPYPTVGYGTLRVAPYQWPGSKENAVLADTVAPPPTPQNLRPVILLSPCPAGQMRMPARPVLPGQTPPAQPCVPIAQAEAAQAALKAKVAAEAAALAAARAAAPPPSPATAQATTATASQTQQ